MSKHDHVTPLPKSWRDLPDWLERDVAFKQLQGKPGAQNTTLVKAMLQMVREKATDDVAMRIFLAGYTYKCEPCTPICHCGKPIHYASPETRKRAQEIIARMGRHIPVEAGDKVYKVDRHYLALHGLKAGELPELGFEEI